MIAQKPTLYACVYELLCSQALPVKAESRPHSLELMIKYTHSCDDKKTTAVNRNADQCSRFSVSEMVPGELNDKKFHDLLCIVS